MLFTSLYISHLFKIKIAFNLKSYIIEILRLNNNKFASKKGYFV